MAVPWASVPEVLERSPEWEGRIIIDATHPPFREDGSPLGRDVASPADRIVALAPGAHVVMAFNTLSATVLAQPPTEAGGRRVIFYSGDHARAKRKVASLISCLGFAAVDLGPLAEGGRLQVSPSGALAMLNFVQLPSGSPTGGVTAWRQSQAASMLAISAVALAESPVSKPSVTRATAGASKSRAFGPCPSERSSSASVVAALSSHASAPWRLAMVSASSSSRWATGASPSFNPSKRRDPQQLGRTPMGLRHVRRPPPIRGRRRGWSPGSACGGRPGTPRSSR